MKTSTRFVISAALAGACLLGTQVFAAPPHKKPQVQMPVTVGPPAPAAANAKGAKAPSARQSPYARAAHEDAMAENAAMAQMQAKGQPLPPRLSHGSGPAAAKGSKASH